MSAPESSLERDTESVPGPKMPRSATEPSAARIGAGDETGNGTPSGGWKDDGVGSTGGGWREQARRRPVVFDEDDDLDVPDFLK
jgi:cell division protein FtsZ